MAVWTTVNTQTSQNPFHAGFPTVQESKISNAATRHLAAHCRKQYPWARRSSSRLSLTSTIFSLIIIKNIKKVLKCISLEIQYKTNNFLIFFDNIKNYLWNHILPLDIKFLSLFQSPAGVLILIQLHKKCLFPEG